MRQVGEIVLNATGVNCTCVSGATEFDEPLWACEQLPEKSGMTAHNSQVRCHPCPTHLWP